MAISATLQQNILGLTLGAFNMSAGGTYLSNFANYVTNVQTTWNLTDDQAMQELARALVSSPAFQEQMAGKVTAADQATVILTNFGLQGDAALLASTTAAIAAFPANNVNGHMASLIWGYTKGLMSDATVQAAYPTASATFANKLQVATAVSATNPLTTTSVSSLKATVSSVTSDAATVTAAINGTTTGQTFTLTTGVDNIVGTASNDTINGYINTTALSTTSTLTAADVVNGGAGVDTMNLVVEGILAGALPNTTITNVEKFFFRDVATAASTYNFATINGETEVWADTATNAVTFSNLGTGATVGIKGNNVMTTLGNVSFTMATATDAVSVAIDGGVKNTVAPTITATAGTATAATISSTGATNTVGAVTLSGGTNTITALTINAATDLTAALVATDYAATATMTVTGAGKVNVGANFDGATIDASANTGGLTASTTATVTKSVKGSTAADTITLVGALTATGTIDLGAGNDKLLAGAGASIVATNVIDGGAGIDTIAASLITAGNAASIKNFENLDLSANATLDLDLMTGSTITGLTLTGGAGVTTLSNVGTGVGLTVSGANTGSSTIGVKGATTSTTDSFAITFAGAAAAAAPVAANVTAGTVVVNDVETVSISSAGGANTWNSITLTDSKLKTLTITGDKNLDVAFAGVNGTNTAAGAGGAVNMIDGSAATGKLNINTTAVTADDKAGVGLTVKGGSANDTITLAQVATVNAGAGDDTITTAATGGTLTGGAGNDKFAVAASVSGTAALTTVTDLTAGDSIQFTATSTTFNNTAVNISTATDFASALALVATTANAINYFVYGGNTYIVDNGATTAATDNVIVKLSGVVDLSTGHASVAAGLVTVA